jgi:hypothetical protein
LLGLPALCLGLLLTLLLVSRDGAERYRRGTRDEQMGKPHVNVPFLELDD